MSGPAAATRVAGQPWPRNPPAWRRTPADHAATAPGWGAGVQSVPQGLETAARSQLRSRQAAELPPALRSAGRAALPGIWPERTVRAGPLACAQSLALRVGGS